jgi:hypothetical protein
MLPVPLTDILNTWAAKDLSFNTSVEYRPHPSKIVPGEYIISVKRETKLAIPGKTQNVKLTKFFHTIIASSTDLSINAHADEYRLKRFLDHFDNDFISNVIDAESRLIEEINPPGFF